jgi:hypothetical protein
LIQQELASDSFRLLVAVLPLNRILFRKVIDQYPTAESIAKAEITNKAFLRWKWLKVGRKWNPKSGEKGVVSEELMKRCHRSSLKWDSEEVEAL